MQRPVFCLILFCLIAACSDATKIEPGQWEMTTTFATVSLPEAPEPQRSETEARVPPPVKTLSCITPIAALDPDGGLFSSKDSETCKTARFTMTVGKVNYDGTCQVPVGENRTILTGTYDRTSIDTQMEMTISGPGATFGPLTMTGTMNWRWIGECP